MTVGGHEIVVDLNNRTCACRRWQLTGIPCHHAVSCIYFQKQNPEDYIHACYEREKFIGLYSNLLEPVNGEEFWEATNQQSILPPVIKVAPGRPKKKRDRKNDVVETRENDPTMLKRKGTTLSCAWCKEYGHNVRSCKTKVCSCLSPAIVSIYRVTTLSCALFVVFLLQKLEMARKSQEEGENTETTAAAPVQENASNEATENNAAF